MDPARRPLRRPPRPHGAPRPAGPRLALLLLALAAACGEAAPRRPNLVLITVDTLRADRLGCYGHEGAVTPRIDALAAEGVRFRRALSQAPWTLPSMASLATSLYPSEHGVLRSEHALPAEARTLAERLAEAGYRTLGVVSHVYVGARHGMDQGFQVFDETNARWHEAVSAPGQQHL